MRLHYLKLYTPFRGLPAGFEINFNRPGNTNPVEPICLVGLNGSGKSNLMQAIAHIFHYLSCINHSQAGSILTAESDHQFTIRYELLVTPYNLLEGIDNPGLVRESTIRQVQITRKGTNRNIKAEYNYKSPDFPEWETVKSLHHLDKLLPRYVIGYSSGQNELISNPFVKMDFLYYQSMRHAVKGNALEDRNRMFFMDYHINAMVLIINYINKSVQPAINDTANNVSDLPRGAIDILDEFIGIDDITSFSITMNLKVKIERSLAEIESLMQDIQSKGSSAFNPDFFRRYVELPTELLQFVQNLLKVSTTAQNVLVEEGGTMRRIKVVMYFRMDDEMRKAFQGTFRGTAIDFFRDLYFLNLLNINLYSDDIQEKVLSSRYKVSINGFLPKYSTEDKVFHIDDIKLTKRGNEIDYKNLSDGEHQFMHIAGTLMLLDDPGTLFLLDEPETHFNPKWRSHFIYILNKVAREKQAFKKAGAEFNEAQSNDTASDKAKFNDIILTTHSPFILSDSRKESIFIFERSEEGYVEYRQPTINTYGASAHVLLQQIFKGSNTISEMTNKQIEKLQERSMNSAAEIEEIKTEAAGLGDSVEKFLLFVKLQQHNDKLKS